MHADLFGNKVKRKDTKVSKHYAVTGKHENNYKKEKQIFYAFQGDRTHGPKFLRLRIKCTNHHAREDVTFYCELR